MKLKKEMNKVNKNIELDNTDKKLHISDVMNSNFTEFRNNVFCRRESNQHKAKKLWNEISKVMNDSDKTLFRTEWSHYMMGDCELDVEGFSLFFNEYVKKYYS
jgi:hypothetical protein